MKHDRLWERLIECLNEWATARGVPGGIEVTFEQSPGATRRVEIVMSPADWDDYVGTMYGTGGPDATRLKEKLLATPDEARYLIYRTYDWEPSETRELPRHDVDPGPGGWVVTDGDGRVIDRFAGSDERH